MSFSNSMKKTAQRLLNTYGEAVVVTRNITTVFNPADGTTIESTPFIYSGYGHPEPFDKMYSNESLVIEGDINLIFCSEEIPDVGDVFNVADDEYTCVAFDFIRAQGTNIVFSVHLRK